MRHTRLLISFIVTGLLFAGLLGAWSTHHQVLHDAHYPQTRTATLLLPGDGGNWLSLRSMTLTLSQPHVATHSLTAHVATNGTVTWDQLAPVRDNNPIIPVLFADNTHPQRESDQLVTVLSQLRTRYHISRVNLVGHSSGGMIALDYLNQATLAPVTVDHLVCIGADFPGQSPLRRDYPQLRVLNLAGVIDNVPNDGEVPVSDAQQLRPLVTGHVASYRLRLVRGHLWQTEHSLLHENGQVDRQIADFIYPPS
ncbi:MAG TPA: alpha/beta hydrolase [Candidatus Levilactobacillus faecigallinarum]|uniref:Alpha/beta hydrolase n=1 Tax=Candidatus Levilactobacillus faecigallinarum TaxID=2838638 RepID=A0A9D1U509_9LACO|nr:alpha/beta hydrolase [Candidatus Levilactobacillus faecigallinarum]